MTVLSNGRLVSEEKDPVTGLVAVHWSQDKPHANYLITLVAGFFKKIEDKHNNIPLSFYTPPSEINEAASSFRDTKDIMAFFEQEIGVPYPWPKYDQVCVNDFVAGGMENTSCTTLTDNTLFTEATENIRDSEGLVSHEMAHQWFGDLVPCKDWSDISLNEGFATYYESLYHGHKNGRDPMLYELYQRARQITGMTNDTNAIVRRTYDSPGEMFGYLAYPKGGWVLRMLRSQLGEDLYRRCIRTYLERHRFDNVVTEDLRAVIEEFSGRSYDQFFDQWVYHAHHPELEVNYGWDEKTKLAKVTVKQTQNGDLFYGVRIEASKALRSIHSDEALEALLESTNQGDARVRRQVIADLGGFYRQRACDSARQVLDTEKNPDILAAALRALGGYAKPEVPETVLRFLNAPSYRNELADAAIAALRSQDDPVFIPPLVETLAQREAEFTSRAFAQALGTLAYLARNEEKKDRTREFLAGNLSHRKRTIQLAAINALATLGDPKAIAALEKSATAARDSPERAAAERALADLRAARKPVDDFKNLRQEVLDLEKANRDLRKELDTLKRKVDAAGSRPETPSSNKGKRPSKQNVAAPKTK